MHFKRLAFGWSVTREYRFLSYVPFGEYLFSGFPFSGHMLLLLLVVIMAQTQHSWLTAQLSDSTIEVLSHVRRSLSPASTGLEDASEVWSRRELREKE